MIIFVGGLPQVIVPPLGYKVTWCVEYLIEEYVRNAKIVKEGKTIEIEALDGLEEVEFPEIGRLEEFYTDGVRTLHKNVKAENMWEKTLRYPGHVEKIRTLRSLGFFDEEPIEGTSP
ncbi:MAG: saccharopine dehydrogenase family protein [Thermoproteota archaeon]